MIGYLATVIVALGMSLQQPYTTHNKNVQPIVDRNPKQMCDEVAHEINIQVQMGMMSESKGRQVIDRCYRIFVDSK